jgi:hypothetical protein
VRARFSYPIPSYLIYFGDKSGMINGELFSLFFVVSGIFWEEI